MRRLRATSDGPSFPISPEPHRPWDATRRPAAFTLIELLVVISIIGLLVALLLPAIEGARESARRSVCGSKMRDLGIAIHGYQSRQGYFPAAGRGYQGCLSDGVTKIGDVQVYNANGLVELLPFLNQRNLYDSFDHSATYGIYEANGARGSSADAWGPTSAFQRNTNGVGISDTTNPLRPNYVGTSTRIAYNAQVGATYVSEFRCPSDAAKPTDGRPTNYDFITLNSPINGVDDSRFPGFSAAQTEGSWCNIWAVSVSGTHARMFGQNSITTPAHVRDGLSNTLAFGETVVTFNAYDPAFRWADRSHQNFLGIDPTVLNVWTHFNGGEDTYWQPKRGTMAHWVYNAASLHPMGCNFVMGDGAVRFFSEDTPLDIFRQLKRMRDGTAPTTW